VVMGLLLFQALVFLGFGIISAFLLLLPVRLIIEALGMVVNNHKVWVILVGSIISNNLILPYKVLYCDSHKIKIFLLSIVYGIVILIVAFVLHYSVNRISLEIALVFVWIIFSYGELIAALR